MATYGNLDLRIRGDSGRGYTVEAEIDGGGSVPSQELKIPQDSTFEFQLNGVLSQITSRQDMQAVGRALFGALFPSEIRDLWARAQSRHETEELRIRLDIEPSELAALPWEMIFDGKRYLGLRPRFPIVRYLKFADAVPPHPIKSPLRVLIAISQPTGTPSIDTDAQVTKICQTLLQLENDVQVETLEHTRRDTLLERLCQGYHVLHYIGHGKVKDGESYLILEDVDEQPDGVAASLLSSMMADSDLHLVVLSACKTSISRKERIFTGLAQQLVRAGVPTVIAMQLTIADTSAFSFNHGFYGALVAGKPVEIAVQEGRLAIQTAMGNQWNEGVDWAIPTLHTRVPNGMLLALHPKGRDKVERPIQEQTSLEVPTGAVPLDSSFYVTREADALLQQQLERPRTVTTIRGGRQSGKTSLLIRGVDYARRQDILTIHLDFQQTFVPAQLETIDSFCKAFAYEIADRSGLDFSVVDDQWRGPLSPLRKLTRFIENEILKSVHRFVLALDEVDKLLDTPYPIGFFGLLRAWYNLGASEGLWQKLNIVMAISTHPSLLIDNISQSPFNVGLKVELKDFDEDQVRDLNHRHQGPLQPKEIPEAMNLLGGHPYLVRQALYTLVKQRITWPELVAIAHREDGPFGSHLRNYLRLLHKDTELMKAARQVVLEGECPHARELLRLTSAGLVREDDGKCICRYGLYEKFFRERLR